MRGGGVFRQPAMRPTMLMARPRRTPYGGDGGLPASFKPLNMLVDLFDFALPPEASPCVRRSPRFRAACFSSPRTPRLSKTAVVTRPPHLAPAWRRAGRQRHPRHSCAARRVSPARRDEGPCRGDADRAAFPNTWRVLARPAKKLGLGERSRWRATSARARRRRGQGRGRRGDARLRSCRRRARRGDRGAGQCRCRPISPASAPPTRRESDYQTVFARRPARSPRRRRGCISRRSCSTPGAAGVAFHRVTLHVGAGTFCR